MGQYRVDSSDMPIVRITFDGAVSDDEFRAYLDAYDAIVDEGKPYVAVFDARTAAAPPARQRRMMAKWLNDRGPAVRRVCHGGAFAITSRVIRGALTAILWLAPLPFEHTVVGTIEEAEDWVARRLRMASGESLNAG